MTKIVATPKLDFRAVFEIDEAEARFLDALIGYGGEKLVAVVKAHLGKAYMDGHEQAGIRFCDTLRQQLPSVLRQFDDARKVFAGERQSVVVPRNQMPADADPLKQATSSSPSATNG